MTITAATDHLLRKALIDGTFDPEPLFIGQTDEQLEQAIDSALAAKAPAVCLAATDCLASRLIAKNQDIRGPELAFIERVADQIIGANEPQAEILLAKFGEITGTLLARLPEPFLHYRCLSGVYKAVDRHFVDDLMGDITPMESSISQTKAFLDALCKPLAETDRRHHIPAVINAIHVSIADASNATLHDILDCLHQNFGDEGVDLLVKKVMESITCNAATSGPFQDSWILLARLYTEPFAMPKAVRSCFDRAVEANAYNPKCFLFSLLERSKGQQNLIKTFIQNRDDLRGHLAMHVSREKDVELIEELIGIRVDQMFEHHQMNTITKHVVLKNDMGL